VDVKVVLLLSSSLAQWKVTGYWIFGISVPTDFYFRYCVCNRFLSPFPWKHRKEASCTSLSMVPMSISRLGSPFLSRTPLRRSISGCKYRHQLQLMCLLRFYTFCDEMM
jgi:hypothetical protein